MTIEPGFIDQIDIEIVGPDVAEVKITIAGRTDFHRMPIDKATILANSIGETWDVAFDRAGLRKSGS